MEYFRVLKNITVRNRGYKTTIGYTVDISNKRMVQELVAKGLAVVSDKPFLFANGKLLEKREKNINKEENKYEKTVKIESNNEQIEAPSVSVSDETQKEGDSAVSFEEESPLSEVSVENIKSKKKKRYE